MMQDNNLDIIEINKEGLPVKILENIKIQTGLKFDDRDEEIILDSIKDSLEESELISQEIPSLGVRCILI